MKYFWLGWGLGIVLAPLTSAEINVPLTVQEAIYPGSVAGINRIADPVSAGIPLPDDATGGVHDANQLTLTGAAAGQFRVLGRWPSGRIKWVLVDTQADIRAGQQNTAITLTNTGTGNFGGPNLATDNAGTITVATGAATFRIRKAHFNGIDEAVVGDKTIVAGGSEGLVITGPAPGSTTCPPCTTVYSSANDPDSTAEIEENGPVKTVIKATGAHKDPSGNAYMRFTVRMYFYKNKAHVKITSILRNADFGKSNTFAAAYKGHQSYELRIKASITGPATYAIGNHTDSPSTGTIEGAGDVYLYQGESQLMKWQDWCGWGCVPYTKDAGYSVVRNGTAIISGTGKQYSPGWADIRDAAGAGLAIGIYQMAAYWPKSLEFNAGGTDVRIGIWARQNSQPYYQSWPQWSIHDLYVNFHATTPASPTDDFLRFQHYLVARAAYTHYNDSRVFPYPLTDPNVEDDFYRTVQRTADPPKINPSSACCIQDLGLTIWNWPINVYRFYAWRTGSGANQSEFRWSQLLNFLTRGMTGRYLDAAHFYRFQTEATWPHSDGFRWIDHPGEYDGFGMPRAASANSDLAFRNWSDAEHNHTYGMGDYYFLTGDETVRDGILDGYKEYFLSTDTYQAAGTGTPPGHYNSRSIGVYLMGAARMYKFLAAIGDADADAVLVQAMKVFNAQVKPDLCLSGHPTGCSLGGPVDGGPILSQGVSRVRGVPWGAAGTSGTWCGVSHTYRVNSGFQAAILAQGILEISNAAGPGWTDYWTAVDLAYGIASWNLTENYVDDGTGRWDVNGFRFGLALDVPNKCTGAGETPEPNVQPTAMQTVSMTFLAKYLVDHDTSWEQKFKINLQKDMVALGISASDLGSYHTATIINILSNPGGTVLKTVPDIAVTDNGGGSYTISWTVPQNAKSYRIKWANRRIVDWVGFDPINNVFTGDPVNTIAWFAAQNAPEIPVPGTAGSTQNVTVNTGIAGLTAANFSVKAYIQAESSGTTVPPAPLPPAPALVLVSGSGQTGRVGQTLPSPLTVRVTDASGNPVAGATVRFTITAGGGTVNPTEVTTDAQGMATAALTLGLTPGTNSVTASVGAGNPVTFTATATNAAAAQVSWTVKTVSNGWPGYNGWHTIWFDSVSRQTVLYGVTAGSSSIYSTDIYFYDARTNVWTHAGGTGNKTNTCSPSTPAQPGDRHPVGQMTIDSKRNVLWIAGGVCQGNNREDMFYLALNPDPRENKWQQVTPAHFPVANISSAMVYDSDNDVLFLFGSDSSSQTRTHWVYCRTLENATPGTLTPKQAAAGCAAPDDWSQITPAGGVQPRGVAFPGMLYDPVTKKVLLFGGQTGGGIAQNETWAYDVPTRTWTRKALSTTPPPVYNGPHVAQPAWAYNSRTKKIIYHQVVNTGAPADWEYDPVADTWTKLTSTGDGAKIDQVLTYDTENNLLIGFNRNAATGLPEVWQGALSGSQ